MGRSISLGSMLILKGIIIILLLRNELIFKGVHAGRMQIHLRNHHAAEYHVILAKKEENKEKKRKRDDDDSEAGGRPKKKPKPLVVSLTFEEIKEGCLDMTTVNGRPFAAINDSGFRRILDPLLKACGPDAKITSRNILDDVGLSAHKTRKQISDELEGKLISLKVVIIIRVCSSFSNIRVVRLFFHPGGRRSYKTRKVHSWRECPVCQGWCYTNQDPGHERINNFSHFRIAQE